MSLTTFRKILLFTGLVCIAFAAQGGAKGNLTRFPSEKNALSSPDGKYLVINRDDEKRKPPHTLFLRDRKTGREQHLYSYWRYVAVLWSPDSKRLIINDHAGSDWSKSLIFVVDEKVQQLDVSQDLLRKFGSDEKLTRSHHLYIESVDWISNDKVLVKVFGYGETSPKGFSVWYEYTVGGEFRRVQR